MSAGLISFLPSFLAALMTLFLMLGSYFLIKFYWDRSINRDLLNGVIQVVVLLVGTVATILLLPIEQATRENILTFGGLILTGIVAFSSTTVIRDAAAGITLRIISPFTRGDYLRTSDVFGRISEIGFFYTEVQTEDRSLVTVMNSTLVSQNFRTIPSSGTLLTTEVSIGYGVPRKKVEAALIDAAEAMELQNPIVHVLKQGNFAVTYRVAGLFEDFENLVTARSDFRKKVLDYLHSREIEIVSPNFMNRRDVSETSFVPEDAPRTVIEEEGDLTTEVIFEKALEAGKVEKLDELMEALREKKESLKASDADASGSIEVIDRRIETIERRKEQLKEDLSSED